MCGWESEEKSKVGMLTDIHDKHACHKKPKHSSKEWDGLSLLHLNSDQKKNVIIYHNFDTAPSPVYT